MRCQRPQRREQRGLDDDGAAAGEPGARGVAELRGGYPRGRPQCEARDGDVPAGDQAEEAQDAARAQVLVDEVEQGQREAEQKQDDDDDADHLGLFFLSVLLPSLSIFLRVSIRSAPSVSGTREAIQRRACPAPSR